MWVFGLQAQQSLVYGTNCVVPASFPYSNMVRHGPSLGTALIAGLIRATPPNNQLVEISEHWDYCIINYALCEGF